MSSGHALKTKVSGRARLVGLVAVGAVVGVLAAWPATA
ncbi:MAG: hypothetical protein JWQ74_1853, partial [Marmoricola sp.]|nr:hypothetical protein [Marmoricola sp.]